MFRTSRRQVHEDFFVPELLEKRALLATTSLELTGSTIATLSAPFTSIVVADFNHDGANDLAVASGRQILLYAGHGDGQFGGPVAFAELQTEAGLLAVADINGDQLPDLLAAQRSQARSGLGWLRAMVNVNGYQLSVVSRSLVAGRVASICASKVDGDGNVDAIVTTEPVPLPGGEVRPAALEWYERAGSTMAFRKRLDVAREYFPMYPPCVADIDDDGRDEIMSLSVRDINRTRVRMLRFDGAGIVTTSVVMMSAYVSSGTIADLDGTGPRLVFLSQNDYRSAPSVVQRLGTIDLGVSGGSVPTFGAVTPELWMREAESSAVTSVGPDIRIVGMGDMNGDGRTDVAITGTYDEGSNEIEAYAVGFTQLIQNSPGAFDAADTHAMFYDWYSSPSARSIQYGIPAFTVADVRGNGRLDLIALRFQTPPLFGVTDFVHPSLVLVQNTQAWKAPTIGAVSLYGHASGQPATLSVEVSTPELARGAAVSRVRAYRDTNDNGELDGADMLLGTGLTQEYSTFPERAGGVWKVDIPVDSSWLHTSVRLFLQAEDSTGVLSEPRRFVLTLPY